MPPVIHRAAVHREPYRMTVSKDCRRQNGWINAKRRNSPSSGAGWLNPGTDPPGR